MAKKLRGDPLAGTAWQASNLSQISEPLDLSAGSLPSTLVGATVLVGRAARITAYEQLEEGPPKPASPLDRGPDSFIIPVFLGNDPSPESTWLPDDEPHISEPLDLPVGSRPSTSSGAVDLAGGAAQNTVYEQPSTPSQVQEDLGENHKERSSEKQQPAAGPSTPQNMPRASAAEAASPPPYTLSLLLLQRR